MVLYRYLRIVFWPYPLIAILKLPNYLSHRWPTFLKRCYWFVRQEYYKHVTMKGLIFCINLNKNIDSYLHYNSNEFQNRKQFVAKSFALVEFGLSTPTKISPDMF